MKFEDLGKKETYATAGMLTLYTIAFALFYAGLIRVSIGLELLEMGYENVTGDIPDKETLFAIEGSAILLASFLSAVVVGFNATKAAQSKK